MKPPRMLDAITPDGLRDHMSRLNKVTSNITFGSTLSNSDEEQNMDCWKASGTAPGVANTDFTISHRLGRIPITIGGQDTDNGGLLYRGTVAWTAAQVTLRCTTANANYKIVLI